MRKISFIITSMFFIISCKNESQKANDFISKVPYNDSVYVLNKKFAVGDVRRYGVFPNMSIGEHANLLKDKMEVLLDLGERGIKLDFPEGIYDRTFNIDSRSNVSIKSQGAIFTGPVNIKNSNGISISGVISSLSQF